MSHTTPRLPLGAAVRWTSQSRGYEKKKTGEVIAFIPAGEPHRLDRHRNTRAMRWRPAAPPNHPALPDNTAWWQMQCGSDCSSQDRYLVRVERDGKKPFFYGPLASVLEAQNPEACDG